MTSASKTTFSHYNLKILRPKVTKIIKNLHKKFCEFRPRRHQEAIVQKNYSLRKDKCSLNFPDGAFPPQL